MRIKDFSKADKKVMNEMGFSSKKELAAFVSKHELNGKTITKAQLIKLIKHKQRKLAQLKANNAKKNRKQVDKHLVEDELGDDEYGNKIKQKRNYGIPQAEKKRGEKYVFNCPFNWTVWEERVRVLLLITSL